MRKTSLFKRALLSCLGLFSLNSMAQVHDYGIRAVPFTQVKLADQFWLSRIETNRKVTIPASFERCESTGRVENFVKAYTKTGKFGTTFVFDDTDIYKTIEGAAFSLAVHPDPKLDRYVDSLITIVGKAQEQDGYLYTARTINPSKPFGWAGPERWVKEHEQSHELYNAGHLYEAAAAHFLATGKKNLLNIALKNADLLVNTFGPGKLGVAPGHEIVEMGLVRLYRITGKKAYLDLSKFFIDERGKRKYDVKSKDPYRNGEYWQDAKPVIQQDEAVGHAVRAMYLYSAVADVAALTGDRSYLTAIDKIWDNMVGKKIYVQGGIGAVGSGERFGVNYELPNATAYNETCAAIGNVYWNQRMFQLHGDSKYIDVLEHVLYNGLISGVGLDGKSFFYTNAMEIKTGPHAAHAEAARSGWFECSCCPTNLARFLPSLPGYMYAADDQSLFVNLFIKGAAKMTVAKKEVEITQENNYPWDGHLVFKVNPKSAVKFPINIRIPGWAQNQILPSDLYAYQQKQTQQIVVKVNGAPFPYQMQKGYAVINRVWKKNDQIEIVLPMEVKEIVAGEKLTENKGKVALQRGPIVYCAEWADNSGSVNNFILPKGTAFKPVFEKDLLNGVMVLRSDAPKVEISNGKVNTVTKSFTAIPYYSWANRGKGEMMVWFPQVVTGLDLFSN